jgi:hypothetical protein
MRTPDFTFLANKSFEKKFNHEPKGLVIPILDIGIFRIKFGKKNRKSLFLPGIHQKYSSTSKCVDDRDIRMNKHKNLAFRLILRKQILGPKNYIPVYIR